MPTKTKPKFRKGQVVVHRRLGLFYFVAHQESRGIGKVAVSHTDPQVCHEWVSERNLRKLTKREAGL